MKILVIPMDDRPCTYNFPLEIGNIYGAEIIVPPKDKMGNLEKIADRNFLINWLKTFDDLDGIIIASDTLAYGGLIPSRRNYESFKQVAQYLQIIVELKKDKPDLFLYVCSTILRISNSNENQEEKEYWQNYGKLIHQYSSAIDKNYLINDGDYDQCLSDFLINPLTSNSEIKEIAQKIPLDILEDYIKGRLKNFKINKLLIKWVKEGFIDYLCICADDSSQYGFNVVEKRILNQIVNLNDKIKDRINIYPGADEAISSLVAGLINRKNNFKPTFYPVFSQYSKGKDLITMYEGIPLKNTLTNQINVLNGFITNNIKDAQIILYIYTAEKNQVDQYLNSAYHHETIPVPEAIKAEFIDYLSQSSDQEKVLIDLAYANGADNSFISELAEKIDLKSLSSFSAWNTSGNSIGTALAHSSMRYLSKLDLTENKKEKENNHYKFLAQRFLDDWLYQGFTRLNYVYKNGYHLSQTQLSELKYLYSQDIKKYSQTIELFKIFPLKEISFPWDRPFEVAINCE